MPLIIPANTLSAAGYSVANSCRFDGSNDYLTITFSGSPTSNQKGTVSYWTKRSGLGVAMFGGLSSVETGVVSYGTNFVSGDNLDATLYYPGSGDDYEGMLLTNAKFRDTAAWMHIVFAWDTTQSTNTNRFKLYVNGVNQKDAGGYSTENYPDQNQTLTWGGTSAAHRIGANPETANDKWNGYMAEVVYTDGTQYAASDFGEFDEDSPTIWKPKDVSGLTFGDNGFYLDFEDSSALGNDVSGNDNDFAASGIAAVDQATDTPTNNFCTVSPLYKWNVTSTLSEGNCKAVGGSGWSGNKGTIAVSKGKWYWEIKLSAGTIANNQHGVQEINVNESAADPDDLTGTTVFFNDDGGEVNKDSTATTADYGTLDSGDILGIALNMDGGSYGQITFYDQNSAIVSNFDLSTSSDYVMPFFTNSSSTIEINFGGCSAFTISSAANDENGYGNFEFAPPSGYLALCTQNLATDG